MIGRGAIAVVAVAMAACHGGPGPAHPIGPPLDATWSALDGGTVRLADLRGQIVIVNAFATWSPATALELEPLTAADAAPDVAVIGLAFDPEGYPLVAPWRTASAVPYLVALTDDATRAGAGALGRIAALPTTIILDGAGREVARLPHQINAAELDAAIARARASR